MYYWNSFLPGKVNINNWRLFYGRLPTRVNLNARGIDLHSSRCPVCNEDQETETHLFVGCSIAKDLWSFVFNWWNLQPVGIEDLLNLYKSVVLSDDKRKLFDAVIKAGVWFLWIFRNHMVFNTKKPRKNLIADNVRLHSFVWISSRALKLVNLNWLEWICYPYSVLTNT